MSKRNRTNQVGKAAGGKGLATQSNHKAADLHSAQVARKGVKTSSDLCEIALKTIEDLCLGNVQVARANGIFNGVGRVCKLKELEMNYAKTIGGKAGNAIKLLPV